MALRVIGQPEIEIQTLKTKSEVDPGGPVTFRGQNSHRRSFTSNSDRLDSDRSAGAGVCFADRGCAGGQPF